MHSSFPYCSSGYFTTSFCICFCSKSFSSFSSPPPLPPALTSPCFHLHLYPFCTPSIPLLYPFCTPSVPHLYPFCAPSLPLLCPIFTPSVPHLYPFCTPSLPPLYPFYCFCCFILSLSSSSIFSFQHYHYLKAIIIKTHAGTQLSSFSWSERS